MIGRQFGRITVINFHETDKHGQFKWLCLCSCGKETTVNSASLNSGNTRSCGCLIGDAAKETHTKHGLSEHPLYFVWGQMRERCYNPKCRGFKNYGARGIEICREWRDSFASFYEWAKRLGYQRGLTVERINNNGNYSPWNCRLATHPEQCQNTRNTKLDRDKVLCIRMDSRPFEEIAKEYGIHPHTVYCVKKRISWKNIK